jgi:hypothetical protein
MPRDGYWWAKLETQQKEWYVVGFSEASTALQDDAKSYMSLWKCKEEAKWSNNATANMDAWNFGGTGSAQIAEGLDDFYKDVLNKHIDIVPALLYVRAEIKGEPADELADRLQNLRKYSVAK